jgi:hypothetical protein
MQIATDPCRRNGGGLSAAHDVDVKEEEELQFDVEWLAVLRKTHGLLRPHRGNVTMPAQVYSVTEQVRLLPKTYLFMLSFEGIGSFVLFCLVF